MEEPLIRTLEEQIAEKIKNYRKGTGVYDAEHVDRWISQFPEEERMVVLTSVRAKLCRPGKAYGMGKVHRDECGYYGSRSAENNFKKPISGYTDEGKFSETSGANG